MAMYTLMRKNEEIMMLQIGTDGNTALKMFHLHQVRMGYRR